MPLRQTFGLVPHGSVVLLYCMFLICAAVFCVGLARRLRASGLINLVVSGPGGVVGGVGRLLEYGLLQRRVAQRARGWPHLGIFYGFLTLLFGTTVVALDWDLMRPLGRRILVGSPYLYLEALLDAFGLVFVVSLVAALVWRLIKIRNTGHDQRRMQWQFVLLIAGLLYMGITGFVLEALRLVLDPTPWAKWSFVGNALAGMMLPPWRADMSTIYVGLWLSHAFVAFTLIAALPFFSFMHSIMAPLNLLIHPGRAELELHAPFDLRELQKSGNFDVQVGVATLDDMTPSQRFALIACTNCGRCDSVCPALASGTALSPRRLVQALRAKQLAGATNTDLFESGCVSSAEVWACTTCAACVEICPVFIRPVDYIVPFRRGLVSLQKIDKRQTEFLGNLGRSFNPFGLPPSNRSRLASEHESAKAVS